MDNENKKDAPTESVDSSVERLQKAADQGKKIEAVKPGGKVLHVKKFMDGKKTPFELWQEIGVRKRCMSCGGPPVIRAMTYVSLVELQKQNPLLLAELIVTSPLADGKIPTIKMKDGLDYVKIGDEAACAHHQKEMEIACAKAPSYYVVIFDRGPDKLKPQVQV